MLFADIPPAASLHEQSVEPWLGIAIVVMLIVVAALAIELTSASREP